MDDPTPTVTSGRVESTLARALVNAQAGAHSLAKDAKNTQRGYMYTTAEAIVAECRRVLNENGLAWSRISSRLRAPALLLADVGKQHYVGDVVIEWRLTYSVTGAYIEGVSEIPIIAKAAAPHDKAAKASETYGSGYILLGLLCLDRDGENGVDSRREPDAKSGGDPRDLIRHAIDAQLELYCKAFSIDIREAWAEAVSIGALASDGGDNGPWSSAFTEADLRRTLAALKKAMST